MPSVTCGHCRGTGKVALSAELQHTLSLIPCAPGFATVPELAHKCGLTNVTTANGRIDKLARMGLIQKAGKSGKAIRWQRP